MTAAGGKFERLTLQFQSALARIVLENPPLNVIDITMMSELSSALEEVAGRAQTSVVVLCGAGTCFSAGVDVAAHNRETAIRMLEEFHRVIRALIAMQKVTIAAVHGPCLGGAAEMAMVCDLVYTADDAKWGFPEIQLGCFPPVAVTSLAALVGAKRAAELILTGRAISGSDAARVGLANEAVTADDLRPVVEQVAGQLLKLSPRSLALTKKAIYCWDQIHFDKGLARAEKIYSDELLKSADAEEGVRAFIEKRDPQWKGC
ncbi:MAG: enoyl-CoA hydratase/isomerase family protein [Acidobacteria bacterium]|nr:enoyl-CoA hydratase/isomerase family protein [Acidobacteriota bacterium]